MTTKHKQKEGIAVIIIKDGKYLLIKQKKEPFRGFWGPVHGKVDANETITQAIIRETKEEIGLSVTPIKKLWESSADYGVTCLHWWLAKPCDGDIKIDDEEISDYRYFPPNQLSMLKLFPATRRFFVNFPHKHKLCFT